MTPEKQKPTSRQPAIPRWLRQVVLPTSNFLVKSQAYMIQHQQDLLNNCVRRNADLVKVCNQVERENQTVRKKLKGHEDGKFWTLIWAMLPTRDMIEPK